MWRVAEKWRDVRGRNKDRLVKIHWYGHASKKRGKTLWKWRHGPLLEWEKEEKVLEEEAVTIANVSPASTRFSPASIRSASPAQPVTPQAEDDD
eukprot:g11945.t1